jgi:two-component system sensor histidine kinase BarA
VFKDLGIKGRVLMLTLLPTSLLALVLGGYFTWVQLSDLQAQLLQRGEMIVEQLAPLAAPALASSPRSASAWRMPARTCSTTPPAATAAAC